jgi:hypothetical protein
MPRFFHAPPARSRAPLAWAGVLFAGIQLALGWFITCTHPEIRDPEYGSLLNALQARLAEAPGHPLVLVLGSSRSANLFRPSPPGPGPVVFNFATLSTGPLRQLQMFRRLLARGIRPRWVVAEFWSPYLTQLKTFAEEGYIGDRDLQPPDGALLTRYFADPWPGYGKLTEGLLVPASSHRSQLLARYAPFLNRPVKRLFGDWSDPALRAGEGFGWLPVPVERPGPELFRLIIARAGEHTRTLLADFRISPVGDGALRELLQACSDHGIRPALVLVPEHSSLRACYPPEVVARVKAYLTDLSRERQVAVIDTRAWVPDDDFLDMTHVLPRAAAPYTERLGREVLRPLVQGRPLPAHLLVGAPSSPHLPAPAH